MSESTSSAEKNPSDNAPVKMNDESETVAPQQTTTSSSSSLVAVAPNATSLEKVSQIVDAVGKEFFAAIRSNADQPQVELEVRLTYPRMYEERPPFQRGGQKRPRESGNVPPQMRTAVTPAVHQSDFARMQQYIQASHASVLVSHSLTEDVNTRDKGRMSFVIESDGSATFMKSVQKSKLAVRDITLPDDVSPYNIRIALSKEAEEEEKDHGGEAVASEHAATTAPPVLSQLQGYRRRKNRTSMSDGEFVYDLTEVTASRNTHTFEVEIEWSPKLTPTATKAGGATEKDTVTTSTGSSGVITEQVVCDLLRRAAQLATLEGLVGMGSEGSQKKTPVAGGHRHNCDSSDEHIPNRPPPTGSP